MNKNKQNEGNLNNTFVCLLCLQNICNNLVYPSMVHRIRSRENKKYQTSNCGICQSFIQHGIPKSNGMRHLWRTSNWPPKIRDIRCVWWRNCFKRNAIFGKCCIVLGWSKLRRRYIKSPFKYKVWSDNWPKWSRYCCERMIFDFCFDFWFHGV